MGLLQLLGVSQRKSAPPSPPIVFNEIFGQDGVSPFGTGMPNGTKWSSVVIPGDTWWTNFTDGSGEDSNFDAWDPTFYGTPPCNLPGSSGGYQLVFINSFPGNGYTYLKTSSLGKTSVVLEYNKYKDTFFGGAPALPMTIDYSVDGGFTWFPVPFTEVVNFDVWEAVAPIVLPAGANNAADLRIRFGSVADGFFNGFYFMDDIKVTSS